MDITNDDLLKYKDKKDLSQKFIPWFTWLSEELGQRFCGEIQVKEIYQQLNLFKNDNPTEYNRLVEFEYVKEYQQIVSRKNRFKDCLNIWQWDIYYQNKVMDLQHVNRCKDRFCPNCRKVNLSLLTQKLMPEIELLTSDGYLPFLITLTIPNVEKGALDLALNRMQVSYKKFYDWLSKDSRKGYKNRLFKIDGSLRAIEITKSRNGTYHPHYHILAMIHRTQLELCDFVCQHDAYKRFGQVVKISNADIQISQLWTLAYHNRSIKELADCFDWRDNFICDIRPIIDSGGFFEVLKYTFKDTDINTYDDFKEYYFALYGRRTYQGYGKLYNIENKLKDDLLANELIDSLRKKERPVTKYVKGLQTLIKDYHDFRKITRYKSSIYEGSFD